ncbi:MAG: hypothetical protein H6R16_1991 [Proteobacteria bacterium]|nr:hypothetical protein [Pseudomonadota bacterium]
MRKSFIGGIALLLLAGSVISAQIEVDDDFMRTVEDTNKSLANNIALKNVAAGTGDAKELEAMFAMVEAFYAAKGDAHDAITITQKSKALSHEIGSLLNAKDFDNANLKATDLSRACKDCHNFYKKS